MIARVHLVIDAHKFAVFIDQKAHTARISRLTISTGAVGHTHASVGIAKQRKRKVILLRKVGILFNVIEADAEDLNIVLVEVANLVAEPATLDRSAGGIGFGIEPQDNFATAQFCQRDLLTLMTHERKVRSRIANLEHYFGVLLSRSRNRDFTIPTPTEIRALNRRRDLQISIEHCAQLVNHLETRRLAWLDR
jgi:hypothetical protein